MSLLGSPPLGRIITRMGDKNVRRVEAIDHAACMKHAATPVALQAVVVFIA